MVMDMPHTGVLAPALRRFLARSAPQATVHWIESGAAFADSDLDPDRLHRVLAALDSYTQERVAH